MQMEKTISPGSVLRWVFQKTIRLAKGFVPRMTEFGFVLPVSEIPCGQGFPWFSDLFLLVLSSVCEHVEPGLCTWQTRLILWSCTRSCLLPIWWRKHHASPANPECCKVRSFYMTLPFSLGITMPVSLLQLQRPGGQSG